MRKNKEVVVVVIVGVDGCDNWDNVVSPLKGHIELFLHHKDQFKYSNKVQKCHFHRTVAELLLMISDFVRLTLI